VLGLTRDAVHARHSGGERLRLRVGGDLCGARRDPVGRVRKALVIGAEKMTARTPKV
jgi:hypothetical protein